MQRHEELDGKRVMITGWLVECQPLSCALLNNLDGLDDDDFHYISLGESLEFDRSVARFEGRPHLVEVEGIIRRTCFSHQNDVGIDLGGDIIVCTDRADQLRNPRLLRVLDRAPELENGKSQ